MIPAYNPDSPTKEAMLADFDPSGIGLDNGHIYGLPFGLAESPLVLLPVPWEATVSFGSGAAEGANEILEGSLQVDLFDPMLPDAWKTGHFMVPVNASLRKKSDKARKQALKQIEWLEAGSPKAGAASAAKALQAVNKACDGMVQWVYKNTGALLDSGRMVGLIGGDHSTPLGYLAALAKRHEDFGILHFDAHFDLREAYEGFTFSHASIMHQAMTLPQISKLVSLGIRDFGSNEWEAVQSNEGRIIVHTWGEIERAMLRGNQGQSFEGQMVQAISALPQKVYISFDIDALQPSLCPGTGTPVPGGFSLDQALFVIELLVHSGREIIGFDLVEVAPSESNPGWDGNVGARLLYKMSNLAWLSRLQALGAV